MSRAIATALRRMTTAAKGDARRGERRALPMSWVAVVTLALCIASEYKFRTRAADQTINGHADPFILLELAVYALVAAFLFRAWRSPPRLRRANRVQVTRWIYVGVLAASATYAVYPALAVARAGELLVSAAFVQAVQQHATSRHLGLMARAFVTLVGVSVVIGLLHRFPSPPLQRHRFTWLYLHPITAANYCGVAIVFCGALWLRNRRQSRVRHAGRAGWSGIAYAGLFLLIVAALFSTRTRSAIGAAAVALLVYALLMTRVFRKRVDLLLALALTGVVAIVVAEPYVYSYISRGESGSQLATLNSRTQLWSQAFAELRRNPLFGHGIGASHGLFLATAGLGGAHDAAINVLTDAGVIGCLAWVVFLGAVLIAEIRLLKVARGPMEAPLLLALFTFLVLNSITTEGLGAAANVQQSMLFLSSAWVIVLAREKSRSARAVPHHPMRILALHPVGDRYGSDKTFFDSVLAMRRSGMDVSVMIAEPGPLESDLADCGLPSRRLQAPVLRKRLLRPLALGRLAMLTPWTLLSLVRTFRAGRADLIYVNTVTLPHCLLAARLSGIPVVCHVRELESSIPRPLSRAMTFPLLMATGVIANSNATAAYLRRDWRPLAGRTVVVYNGIAAPEEAPAPTSAVRKIGIVGRLSPRKGQDVAVEAVSALLSRGLDIELSLIGDCFSGYEWYESQLRQAASEHPSRIRLIGFQSDVWRVYRDLDLVLVPSRLEPFGLVAVEAALSRRAVIAARVGGLPEIVRDGATGILVEPGDAAALARAIESLVADPALADSYGREAQRTAAFRFSPDQAEHRLLAELRRCCGTAVAGRPESPSRRLWPAKSRRLQHR